MQLDSILLAIILPLFTTFIGLAPILGLQVTSILPVIEPLLIIVKLLPCGQDFIVVISIALTLAVILLLLVRVPSIGWFKCTAE